MISSLAIGIMSIPVAPLKDQYCQSNSYYIVCTSMNGNICRLLLHKVQEGEIDGLTMVYSDSLTSWLPIGEVPLLKEAMQQLEAEEAAAQATLNPIPPDMPTHDSREEKRVQKSFRADNGLKYKWDEEEGDWVETDEESEEEEEVEIEEKDVATPQQSNGLSTEEKEEKRKRKRKAKKKKAGDTWEENKKKNLWIYVTGLPTDITLEEIKNHFSKVGIFALNPLNQQPKIKLYKDEQGNLKGDCSICYNAEESVQMAVDILDGGCIRPLYPIQVSVAQFQKREDFQPEWKKNKITAVQLKVAAAANKQALTWNDEDDLGISKRKGLKIIVIEGMFDPSDFSAPSFAAELEKDVANECSKCGDIEKITVFSKNPAGVVVVKFQTAFAAAECIKTLDGRYFAGRKLKSYFWDGVTNYSTNFEGAHSVEAAAKQEEKLLDEFGDWLENEQEELPEEFQLRVEE